MKIRGLYVVFVRTLLNLAGKSNKFSKYKVINRSIKGDFIYV